MARLRSLQSKVGTETPRTARSAGEAEQLKWRRIESEIGEYATTLGLSNGKKVPQFLSFTEGDSIIF